jgi:hypothetical protein
LITLRAGGATFATASPARLCDKIAEKFDNSYRHFITPLFPFHSRDITWLFPRIGALFQSQGPLITAHNSVGSIELRHDLLQEMVNHRLMGVHQPQFACWSELLTFTN